MNLLLVAATNFEVEPLIKKYTTNGATLFTINAVNVDVLLTDIGMVNTAIACTQKINEKKYDFALQIGIAGAFYKQLQIGEVLNITEDCIAELGAEDGEKFISLTEMGLPVKNRFLNRTVFKNKAIENLPKVNALTVNKVHGNEASIAATWNLFGAYVESMEGAAFAQVCETFNVNYAQVRSISNFVEKRNKNTWNIPLAIKELNNKVEEILFGF